MAKGVRYSSEAIERVKSAADITVYIGEVVRLTPRGQHSFVACCPFHQEDTPSFSVDREQGFYYCFGCNARGNVFNFLMQREKIPFPEALQRVALREGIQLPPLEGEEQILRTRAVLESADTFFRRHRDQVMEYLTERRGLEERVIDLWGLGYAPDDGKELRRFLLDQFALTDIVRSGLFGLTRDGDPQNSNDYYSLFRDRVMIPILDHQLKLVGFGGRIVQDRERAPKYLNTFGDTPLGRTPYRKDHTLLGLGMGLEEIRKTSFAYVTEGYFDVVSAHQYGVTNVVAPCGTALTTDQARLLRRFAKSAFVVMDADDAGKNAAIKAARVLYGAGFSPKIVLLPEGKDLDDFVRKHQYGSWTKLRDLRAYDVVEYCCEVLPVNGDDPDNFQTLDLIAGCFDLEPNLARRLRWMEHTAKRLGISSSIVNERYAELLRSERKRDLVKTNGFSLEDVAFFYVINVLITNPTEYAAQFFDEVSPSHPLFTPDLAAVYRAVIEDYRGDRRLQRELPMPHSAGKQTSFLDAPQREKAWQIILEYCGRDVLSAIPAKIMSALLRPVPYDLDRCAGILKAYELQEQFTRGCDDLHLVWREAVGYEANIESEENLEGSIRHSLEKAYEKMAQLAAQQIERLETLGYRE